MKKPTQRQAQREAINESKQYKGSPDQMRSFIRGRFQFWLRKMGL